MELRTLRYFLTVAQEQNITHAAQKLHMSQPPLSRQLQQLEEELGVTLFIRGKRKIELTDEGRYLMQQARYILNMADYTAAELSLMQNCEAKGTLLLGVTETSSASVLPIVLPQFHQRYSKIEYDILCESSNEIIQKLEEGIIDIGFIREPFELSNLEAHFLKSEKWIVAVGIDHSLADYDVVTLEDICKEPLFIPSRSPVFDEICNWFSENTEKPNVIGRYNQISSILPLIAKNMGVCICHESVKQYADHQQIAYRYFQNKDRASKLYMVRQKNKILPAAARFFWDYVCQIF